MSGAPSSVHFVLFFLFTDLGPNGRGGHCRDRGSILDYRCVGALEVNET